MAALDSAPQSWRGKSIVSVEQFSMESVDTLFAVADEMKELVKTKGGDDRLQRRVLATLFYENSTRTSCSFQAAMLRLGGGVLSVAEASSSIKKGETLEDTVACLHSYADVVALRHPSEGAAARAAAAAGGKPVFNAGDGVGEHPTQALLDLYTIRSELGGIEGKTVTMLGDLKHGRTVHSLAKLLALFPCKLRYVSPEALRMPAHILEKVGAIGGGWVEQSEHRSLEENGGGVLEETDVLYVTRVQKERFEDPALYEAVKDAYTVTPELLSRCKARMALMHPLPRVGEISPACDSDPRAAYFRQMENGMFVRMALLALALGAAGGDA